MSGRVPRVHWGSKCRLLALVLGLLALVGLALTTVHVWLVRQVSRLAACTHTHTHTPQLQELLMSSQRMLL